MAICREKLVNYLEGIGYNLVRLPRTTIKPLDIIVKDGELYKNLGSLSKVWAVEPVPQPTADENAANIEQKKTSLIDTSVGVKALESIFSGMGFSVPELNLAFSNSKKMTITFNNVTISAIEPFVIGDYLADTSKLKENNIFVRYFLDNDLPIYVISETLKSNAITINAYKDANTTASLDLGALENAIKANPKVSIKKESDSSITYAGDKQLVFGFKCYQIGYSESRWIIEGIGEDKVYLNNNVKGVKLEEFKRIDIVNEE